MERQNLQLNNKFMEYVVALERYQSISDAAEALYISQPAMSHFIQNLENRLEVKLFNRVNHRYIPTYEGERYLNYAKKIMALEHQMQNEFAEMRDFGHGRIRLALPTLRSAYILPNLLPAYRKRYPHVRLSVQEVHSQLIEKLLLTGEADFAIMNAHSQSKDTISQFIRYDEVMLAVPSGHPCASMGEKKEGRSMPSVDIRLFQRDEFILQYKDQRTRQAADRILSDAGITPSVLLETRSIETALKIVSSGLGVCFAPETYIRQIVLKEPVTYFSLESPHAVFDLSLTYLRNTYLPEYFVDFIRTVKETL